MTGYHFTGNTLRDGRPIPPIGEWLLHDGQVIFSKSGLFASEHPLDALQYADGPWLHKVELEGDLVPHGNPVDKWTGRRRRIIASVDATEMLWQFAREQALSVLHLWDAPTVVREYLETGDESKRDAAWGAARDAVSTTASSVAWYAASAAESAAERTTAWAAATDAASADARDAFAAKVNELFAQSLAKVKELKG